jgi:hypothetical protein
MRLAHLLPHRAFAAFAAIWERLRGVRDSALATPPLSPPGRPSATAWGFLLGSAMGSGLGLNSELARWLRALLGRQADWDREVSSLIGQA